MADTRQILDDEALGFVLKDRGGPQPQAAEADELVATIRGDLEQVSLPDIFQTLTMSAMVGTLRITQGWDPTYIHFGDGQARVLPPEELQARRLGNRLVTSGLLEPKEVRQSFMRARKESIPLSDILEATGKIEKVQFDAIKLALEEDFLLELFTLKKGAFAFFKESYPLPGLEERFEQCMPFEVEQVLLDIARRADEWITIQETIGDLDELFVRTGTSFPTSEDLTSDLYEQIDGKRTLRDIAGGMLDALFDVAKTAKWLIDNECIELAPATHLLNLAREAIDEQKLRRALFYLELVVDNRRTRPDQLEEVASLFVQAGDPRAGASVLLRIVSRVQDPERKYDLLVQARGLDGLNLAVLESLVETMRATAVAGEGDYDNAIDSLCELYIDAGRFDEALALCEELELAHPADLTLASRKARILHSLDRADDGVAHLERLKEVFRFQKNNEYFGKTLEQILRIDPRNGKARAELRSLNESKGVRRLKRFGLVLAIVVVGRVGWGAWSHWRAIEVANRDIGIAKTLLDEGKIAEARKLAEDVASRNIDDKILADAVGLITTAQRRVNNAASDRHAKLVASLQTAIQASAEKLESDDWLAALAGYDAVREQFSSTPEGMRRIKQSLDTRFRTWEEALKTEIENFQGASLADAKSTESAADRKRLFARMERWFPAKRLQAARELLEAKRSDALVTPIPLPESLVERMTEYVEIGSRHRKSRVELAARLVEDEKTEKLNISFVAAQKCEAEHDFVGAAKAYSVLAESYSGSPETAKVFRDKRERYLNIVAGLQELESATRAGDHDQAIDALASLRKRWPEIPFETLVALPLKVDSSPAGARVYNGTESLGVTPILLEYAPGKRMRLRLELDGFFAVEAPEDIEDKGKFSTVFEAKPVATAKFEGSTTRPGVAIAGRYIASDRKASIAAFDPNTGRWIWQVSTNDLSGDLGSMLHLVNKIIVAAPGGMVRAISPTDGTTLWERDLEDRITTPALSIADEIFVLARNGDLHVLDAQTGQVSAEIPLGHSVRHPPIALSGDRFVIIDDESTLRAFDGKGAEAWSATVEGAGWVPLAVSGEQILVAAGVRLESRNASDGSLLWSRTLKTTPRLEIATDETRIALIVGNRDLVVLDARTGEVQLARRMPHRPSAAPLLTDEAVVLPLEKDGTFVLDPDSLRLKSLLARDVTTEIQPLVVGKDRILISGNQGELRVFHRSTLSQR